MKTLDIVTVGDVIIDAFLSIHDADLHCRIDEKACELCIRYGEKIQMDSCEFMLGGNACNVAVAMARAGFATALVAETGTDEFAQKIMKGLAHEGVERYFVQQTPGKASSFAIGINFKGERTLFIKHEKRKHAFTFANLAAKWMYLTSLGEEWKGAYQKALDFVKEKKVKLAFSPGSAQLKDGSASFSDILAATDILFVNKEEAIRIASSSEKEIRELLVDLQKMGPKVVVITDGKNGSYVADGESRYFLEAFPATVIEKTGAGDAFASGFLLGVMSEKDISEAMRWGSVNAASVIGKVGSQAGLLSKEAIEERLRRHKDFQAKTL